MEIALQGISLLLDSAFSRYISGDRPRDTLLPRDCIEIHFEEIDISLLSLSFACMHIVTIYGRGRMAICKRQTADCRLQMMMWRDYRQSANCNLQFAVCR